MIPALRAWEPLLAGELRARAQAAARQIATELERRSDALVDCRGELCDPSLMAGTAGIAVFLHHAGLAFADANLTALAMDALAHAVDHALSDAGSGRGTPSFAYGLAGVAWALAHLGADTDDFAGSVLELVGDPTVALSHTLFLGLVGYGVCAREMPSERARDCEPVIIARLREASLASEESRTWYSPASMLPRLPGGELQRGRFNLGMPHGVSGVLSFLSRCRSVPEDLVRGAARWLLQQELPPGSPSRFPPWIVDGEPREPSEAAWCYGDPCVGMAVCAAGRALADPRMHAHGIAFLEEAAIRSPAEAQVSEPLLCHGAAGLAHLFNRACQSSGSEGVRAGAIRWFEQLLAWQSDPEGFAGFSSSVWKGDRGERMGHPGLLEGASGIGLALLAGACEPEPAWDRAFLLS